MEAFCNPALFLFGIFLGDSLYPIYNLDGHRTGPQVNLAV
jgi:hypothetical protein